MLTDTTPAVRKIIITGTGRTGTTFLVRLLTELGLDTGYTSENWPRDYYAHCEAGLEQDLTDPDAPYIVKSPALCETLGAILDEDRIVIDHAFIPIRELEAAALSRIRIGGADSNVPGGLWKTSNPSQQKSVLAEMFHQLMWTLAAYDIPHTLLLFPRFACDADYAYTKLRPLLADILPQEFRAAFARVSNPSLIHDFTVPETAAKNDIARNYLQAMKHKRQRRRQRRAAWATAAAAFTIMLASLWHNQHVIASPVPATMLATSTNHSSIYLDRAAGPKQKIFPRNHFAIEPFFLPLDNLTHTTTSSHP